MWRPGQGEQLQLLLEGEERLQVPWDGVSPRTLTAAYKRSILKAQDAKSVSGFTSDPDQTEMWPTNENRSPQVSLGAPPLVPNPRRRRG